MKPYYQDEQAGITIYHGDCREVLPTLQRESADLIATDPPYGVRWVSGRRQTKFGEIANDHSTEAAIAGLALALRVLRKKRHVYVFGRYDLSTLPVSEPSELIWDKAQFGFGDTTSSWGCSHEYIQFTTHVPSEANRNDSRVGYGRLAARLRRGSVLRYPRLNSGAVSNHPTEKPVMLMRELIESSSCIGELVLDPFMGSGATLEAAHLEGRKAIGIEIEERYCEVAAKRLQQGILFPAQ